MYENSERKTLLTGCTKSHLRSST